MICAEWHEEFVHVFGNLLYYMRVNAYHKNKTQRQRVLSCHLSAHYKFSKFIFIHHGSKRFTCIATLLNSSVNVIHFNLNKRAEKQ